MSLSVGLLDVDGHKFPNLALMKLSRWHKEHGDKTELYSVLEQYDIVYMSKVFTHTPDYPYVITNAKKTVKGGTGYDFTSKLPEEIDHTQPDYSLYGKMIDKKTAYGFLTRGCINKCPWCIVPKKEGFIRPYMDVDEIAIEGRTHLILMDNNILACEYGISQIRKIVERGYRVDFNQALDALVVTDEIAQLLAKVKWLNYIRFGCDTPKQIEYCHRVIRMIRKYGYNGQFMLYTMLYGTIEECYHRLMYWKADEFEQKVCCQAQPCLDFTHKVQHIPQWQNDMARWANRKWLYRIMDFKDYEPRKDFKCGTYFNQDNI